MVTKWGKFDGVADCDIVADTTKPDVNQGEHDSSQKMYNKRNKNGHFAMNMVLRMKNSLMLHTECFECSVRPSRSFSFFSPLKMENGKNQWG